MHWTEVGSGRPKFNSSYFSFLKNKSKIKKERKFKESEDEEISKYIF